jgi:23S rRNA (uracil1939-C5)-methyltransferase
MTHDPLLTETIVQDLSTDGRGVVRFEGIVYFVPHALPGDRVLLMLNPATKPPSAVVKELRAASPSRVSHLCPHADVCHGSVWGNLDYAEQLKYKRNLVERTLRKMAGDVEVLPTIPSPQQWNYRSRISLRVWQHERHFQMGYHTEARQEAGIPICKCHLASEAISHCLQRISIMLGSLDADSIHAPIRIQIHDTARGAGLLMKFAGRVTPDTIRKWSALLGEDVPGGFWFAEATGAGIVNFSRPIVRSEGALPMQTEWLGNHVEVHPAAFCQANAGAANLVGARLMRLSNELEYARVWDLYGGFGALGLAAAGTQRSLTVFELSQLCERTLETLAQEMEVTHTTFVSGDLLRTLSVHAREINENDLVILDPPHSGAHPDILAQIIHSKVRHVVYLSCNPARLARDMAILFEGGFTAIEIQPYDFFPQTPSTEVLAIFHRS